ncbi:bestrophin-like domain [Streptomyces zagrosensis]|uniref:DUF4239 domain-containing protein n=1 Tax=Streptomyces zagrosensis TaxID=1042984 RepID=A0A7W9V124_9ACTN|nr:DUF4239 domain-containing protein [Streptomyces zagrosensis]MBB5937816.1 hypothetical protein [Streptomyces zagrosensis]
MPEWLVLALAMGAACAVVLLVVFLNQRRVGEDDDPSETPDVIEYMAMMIGVVYAIVLGLAIAGVWEARSAAGDTVRAEAQSLYEVSERVHVYPAPERERIRADVTAYVRHVVDKEFPHMIDKGELTERGDALLRKLRHDAAESTPRDERMAQTYQPLMDQIALADDARGAREQSAGATLPGVVWFGLVGGAMVTVGIVFTLQIRRSPRELLLAGLFSALIAFLLFLVWDFDAPFGQSAEDAATPFTDLFFN